MNYLYTNLLNMINNHVGHWTLRSECQALEYYIEESHRAQSYIKYYIPMHIYHNYLIIYQHKQLLYTIE